jgi:peptide/nickel transport system ATP-binding protein
MNPILRVNHLDVVFPTERGPLRAVSDVSFAVERGESVGFVGESGSGKSTIAFALFDKVPTPGRIVGGDITYFGDTKLLELSAERQRRFYWSKASMVFQAAQNTLNPLLRIGQQIEDIAGAHGVDKKTATKRAAELCEMMYLNPDRVLPSYPHELSGGMKQRVSIALALLLDPALVVLDEPTTALDVISQASVLRILADVRKQRDISLIFITHDISVISQVVDRVVVMYAGKIVETGTVEKIVRAPSHPYTKGLIASIPPLVGDLSGARALSGQPANLLQLPPGCAFASRCEFRTRRCETAYPATHRLDDGSEVACHLFDAEGMEVSS